VKCTPVNFGNGVTGFVCGRREPRKRCSSCKQNWADLECDAGVVKPNASRMPKRGDARVHRQHAVVFYVHGTQQNPDDPSDMLVMIATTAPGERPVKNPHTATAEDWYFKTDATCDRSICRACATRIGKLDFCPPHARALAQRDK
jgi:hypothetical protein